jgi:hypothetical protein
MHQAVHLREGSRGCSRGRCGKLLGCGVPFTRPAGSRRDHRIAMEGVGPAFGGAVISEW